MAIHLVESKTAFLFPGQGSQVIGMGAELAASFPDVRRLYEEADKLLEIPLSKISWLGPEENLNDTVNTQPALLVHSIAALQVFKDKIGSFKPAFVAGHSMGELSALVATESLPFRDTLALVHKRGECMKRAGELNPGGMAAILGLELSTIEDICVEASQTEDVVQIANDNCPGQVVISGAKRALDYALLLAERAGARKVIKLAVSIAAHSPLMASAQLGFNQAIEKSPISNPKISIIGNVSASPLTNISEIVSDLQSQLNSRVRWTETINFMIQNGVDTFIEFGSGSVLTGLLRRINRKVTGISIGTPDDLDLVA